MPSTMERLSGPTSRAITANARLKEENAIPVPVKTPAVKCSAKGIVAKLMPINPKQYITAPAIITHTGPKRSANAPASGSISPQNRF